MRPRFRVPLALSASEVIDRLERRLAEPDCPCHGSVAGNHRVVDLRVPGRDRHFWSPALSVTVTEDEDQDGMGAVVHGVVGPNPNVWTLFAMGYMGLLTLLTGVAIFGFVQWWLDLRPWGLYWVPLLVLGLALMYVSSRIGQRLAAPQTLMLRHFLEDALDLPESERRVTEHDPYHERPAAP